MFNIDKFECVTFKSSVTVNCCKFWLGNVSLAIPTTPTPITKAAKTLITQGVVDARGFRRGAFPDNNLIVFKNVKELLRLFLFNISKLHSITANVEARSNWTGSLLEWPFNHKITLPVSSI